MGVANGGIYTVLGIWIYEKDQMVIYTLAVRYIYIILTRRKGCSVVKQLCEFITLRYNKTETLLFCIVHT